ncbi:hypothetical protein CVS40_3504 [Lucilia cuprina]|nr:hypothetical protein CVS40_3504 [Lucilia cuprina]
MATDPKILELLQKQGEILARLSTGDSITQEQLMDKLANSISEFVYDATNTFNIWYSRHEDIFLVDGKDLDDAAKVRLLMRKLNTIAYGKYAAYILPRNVWDISFAETVQILKSMYGIQESLFSLRYKCLQMVKNPQKDLVSYAARINESCEQLSQMNADQFKCLVFVCGLQSHSNLEVRMKSLSILEDDSDQTVNKLVTTAQRMMNLKHDAAMVEDKHLLKQ